MKNILKLVLAMGVLAAVSGAYSAPREKNEMILIPGGYFMMGSSQDEVRAVKDMYGGRDLYKNYPFEAETPKRKVYLKPFYMDRHEVTNGEYFEFVKATGRSVPMNWPGGLFEPDKKDYPVLYVSQEDAEAYAKWSGKRLPTEAEWEKAARGEDGRVYPWGNEFSPTMCATADSDIRFIYGALCSVNSANHIEMAEGDISPYGVRDMAGNVREWTATADPADSSMALIKGASWVDLSINARIAHREFIPKKSMSHIIGFRCARDADDLERSY